MRILHLDPDDIDNPMSGGGPRRTYEIYRRLARRHEITVLTPTFAGSTPELIRDGVRYLRLGRKVRNHASSHHITYFFALPGAVRSRPYDLLVEDLMPPASATFNPLFARGPVIASVQWFFARMLSRQFHLPFHLFERYGMRLYRNFIVQTTAMEALIRSLAPKARIACLPAGADEALFALPRRDGGDFVLYMGRVDIAQKGLDLLFRAYAQVPSALRIPLIVAGHGDRALVQPMVSELGLAETVRFVGKVDGIAREELFQQCRFVVVPSREETFGMVILEGCAAGKPVALFDVAPMNEVAAPGACEVVEPFDVPAYAAALSRLLSASQDELRNRGDACRSWAQRFSWDAVAAAQSDFYEECVDTWHNRRTSRSVRRHVR
ncbi:MAG: glycosyltransferase family 4 protein [Phycisphaerae bacterium]|nr:glycosyltransferase family 4 protein [Gemmatimonadaceae bacterium]